MSSRESASRAMSSELSSWKEIAAYLGVSLRTAQLWEQQRGLPVRRMPGPRGRVSVTIAALEAWKATWESDRSPEASSLVAPADSGHDDNPGHTAMSWHWVVRGRRILILLAFAAGLLAASYIVAAVISFGGEPASYRIESGALAVLDDRGRELWRKAFPTLDTAAHARERLVHIGDLDGDGRSEVLFVPRMGDKPTPLWCFDHSGVERWRYSTTETVRISAEVFRPPYFISSFAVTRGGYVVVTSHGIYYPSATTLLSAHGKLLRQYWHAGHLRQILVREHDGGPTVYVGGISNSRRAATLIALDRDHWAGASSEPERYQFLGLRVGHERARIIFPRTCMNERFDPFSVVGAVHFIGDEVIVNVHQRITPDPPAVLYHFTPDLRLRRVGVSSKFIGEHHHLHLLGELDHEFSDAEEKELGVLHYLAPETAQSAAPLR